MNVLRRVCISLFVLFIGINKALSADILLVENGKSSYSIFIDADDFESVKEAAKELNRLIKKSTGVDIPIVNVPGSGKLIVLGTKAKDYGVDVQGLARDGFYMKVTNGNLVIAGTDEGMKSGYREIFNADYFKFYNLEKYRRSWSSGTYNGVIQFLMDYVKVRWYMPTENGEEVPTSRTLGIVDNLNRKVEPFFIQRQLDFTDWNKAKIDSARRNKPGWYDKIENITASVEWGRRLRHANPKVMENGHAWRHWIPANEISSPWIADAVGQPSTGYGVVNPNLFALVNNVRQTKYIRAGQQGGQLDVTNPDVVKLYVENILKYADKNPSINDYALTYNDGATHCECSKCLASDPEPQNMRIDSEFQFLTDRFLKFQKQVADEVNKKYPKMEFMISAYHESSRPPKVEKVPTNFWVQGWYNFLPYRFYLPADKKIFENNMVGWGKATDKFRFSTFYTAYGNHGMPWNTMEAQTWLLTLLKENNIKHYESLNLSHYPMIGQSGPDNYVVSQLAWDPNQDVAKLTDEWYTGAFTKEVGDLVKEYYGLIETEYRNRIPTYTTFLNSNNRVSNQKALVNAIYPAIRTKASDLVKRMNILAAGLPDRYKWRLRQITVSWEFVELTIDAIAAGQRYNGNKTTQNYDAAALLGLKRR
ncbi:MAG: DUF4838 domain-containing protein, partial [Leadbetterella sp.]